MPSSGADRAQHPSLHECGPVEKHGEADAERSEKSGRRSLRGDPYDLSRYPVPADAGRGVDENVDNENSEKSQTAKDVQGVYSFLGSDRSKPTSRHRQCASDLLGS